MTGRRIVSIWLPGFPMERWQGQQARMGNPPSDDLPCALIVEASHGPVVHAVNRAARQAGVTVGARLADMRALCPGLKVDFADPEGDRAALGRLALWARRWCPWTVADDWGGQHGLILETTGSDHLLGGEAAMLAVMQGELARLGHTARLGMAGQWGAAWALARYGAERAMDGPLGGLPVAALRLEGETVLLLNRLGLRRIGDLMALPRLALARRFPRGRAEENPLIRLDQLTGHRPEPVSPPEEPAVFRADLRLAEPILDPAPHLPGLFATLCDQLGQAQQGARRLRLTVYRTDGEVRRLAVACAQASRDAGHLAFLFRDRLERIDAGFGFDLVSLEAVVTEPLGLGQGDLGGEQAKAAGSAVELSQLMDRLVSRFGPKALVQLVPVASHIPERSEQRGAPLAEREGLGLALVERPERLLEHPEELRVVDALLRAEAPPLQFQWRRQSYRVQRYQGPERIAPEWWQDRPGTRLRDYFKVEDERGHRFWLYREGLAEDGRGAAPRWFLHGIFA